MRRLRASVRSVVGASSDSNATGITLSSFLKDDRWPDFYRVAQCAAATPLTRDPTGTIGKSIVFAVNQTHATNLTKIFNELQPGLAVTITSRIPNASAIAKEFRDGKRSERIAVSVDMLSTGDNCRDALNIGLMR